SNRNGVVVGVLFGIDSSTDLNIRLLSRDKSIRYLHLFRGSISTNGILALAEYPNLTGLALGCGEEPSKHLLSALPCLTNLKSLELFQGTFSTNDAIYLARMTNLADLQIKGAIPHTQAELLPLTNLVNLQ